MGPTSGNRRNKLSNVIYIHTHDMGRHISPYGYDTNTPNLQAFSERATLFRQAYCCGPTCSPSRAALLTGVTPHESGMLGLAHRGFVLAHPEQHLGAYLREKGFVTALCGIQHEFNSAWEQMPYEHVYQPSQELDILSQDRARAMAAVDFLERESEQPFFLSFGLFYPHRPFMQADYSRYDLASIRLPQSLPDADAVRHDMADYHYSIEMADRNLGLVLDTIKRRGRDQDSIVIITTDHGIAFPGIKCNLNDDGIGVCLMIDYPGNPSAGTAVDGLVSHLDVFPTICDLLSLEPPAHLQGRSMRPMFTDPNASIRDEVFSEVTFHAAYEPMRCIRTKTHKLVRRYIGQKALSNCDDSPSKDWMLKNHWPDSVAPELELYDLVSDPAELNNLSNTVASAAVQRDLESRLERWMRETHDPLLEGQVTPPVGALVNTLESMSAPDGPFETLPS